MSILYLIVMHCYHIIIATEGTSDDFTLMSPHVVTFTAGSIGIVTANVSVMILNDEFVEGLETFELSISSVTSNVLAAVGDQESDVTIRDNDGMLDFRK